jgi:hypothetical protein
MKLLCLLLALCQVPDELPVPFPADAAVPKIIAPMTPVLVEPEMIEVPQPPKKEYPASKIIDAVKFGELYVLESNV